MIAKKITIYFLVLLCFSLIQNTTFGASPETSEIEKQEYKQEQIRIKALRKSLLQGPVNDLKEYEKFADEIQHKWSRRNKEHYARLILEICGPLSSGKFKEDRRNELTRKYALSALEAPDTIPLTLELELIGHVITDMCTPYAPKGKDFAQRRKKDVQIRLHAWKRLIDAIDPNWDSNEELWGGNVPLPPGASGESGMSPEYIKDPKLRAEYKEAIQKNKQKIKIYSEQSRLRKWLKKFPKRAESYVILAYSKSPFNLAELKQYLEDYIADQDTRVRILNAVTKKMAENK